VNVAGITPEGFRIRNIEIASGRSFDAELEFRDKLASASSSSPNVSCNSQSIEHTV